jgi:Uma2 family endonuclease
LSLHSRLDRGEGIPALKQRVEEARSEVMATVVGATKAVMTTEELLALPDDGVERWLIRGQLRENGMTVRNRSHSRILARICHVLETWLEQQPQPRGEVLGGEAGCRLQRDPDTTVGIDVAYIGPDVAAREPADTTLIDGVPILVVEILSPHDKLDELTEKVDGYLTAGVSLIWVVEPHYRTVLVYRPNAEPELFNVRQELSAEPHLPGFRVAVARIFER